MNLTTRHRQIARALWESGGRIEDVARAERLRPETIRRWLSDPEFRALLAQDAMEPLLQATSAVVRWAPAAVARLIRDLDGDSPGDARQAAREILRLAIDAHGEFRRPELPVGSEGAESATIPEDPLSRRMALLTDEQLKRMLEILNGT